MATDSTMNFILEAQNRVSSQISEINSSMKTLKSGQDDLTKSTDKGTLSFGKLAGAQVVANLAVQAGSAIYQGLKSQITEVIQAADSWATAQAQLNAGIQSTGDISGVTSDAAIKLAESIQATTPISREAALSAEDMELTFTSISKDVFPATTQAIADMATRMNNGLTPSAEQLANTAKQVGKALQDPLTGITALHKEGVEFSDQQKAQIATMMAAGDQMGAQKIILAELAKEFGGSAAAALTTFSGKQEQMTNNMNDAKASIGAAIEKAILPFQTAIANFVQSEKFKQWIQDITGFIQTFANDLYAIGQYYIQHAGLINTLASIVGELAVAFLAVAGALKVVAAAQAVWNAISDTNPVLLAITAIIAVILILATHWQQVVDIFNATIAQIRKWFDDAGTFIMGVFQNVVDFFTGVGNNIAKVFSDAKDKVKDFVTGAIDFMSQSIKNVVDWYNKWKGLIDGIIITLTVIFGPLLIKIAAQAIAAAVTTSAAWIANFAKMSASAVVNFAITSAQAVASAAVNTVNAVKSGAIWTAQFTVMSVKAIANAAVQTAQAVISGAKWLAAAVVASGAWVAQFAVMSAQAIAAAVVHTAQAAIAGYEWLFNAGVAAGAWVAQFVIMIAKAIAAAAAQAVPAATAAASWVAASVTGSTAWGVFMAIVSSPITMGAIAVAGALADIALVYNAVQNVISAVNAMNGLKQAQADAKTTSSELITAAKNGLAAGRITQAQYNKDIALANQAVPDVSIWDKLLTGNFATGTSSAPGGLSLVGERGPEIVNLPQGAQVIPANKTQQLLSGANSPTNNISINVTMGMYAGLPSEKRAIAVEMYKEMQREARAHSVQLPSLGSGSVQ